MNKNNLKKAIYSQLYIIKAQLEAMIVMVEELEDKHDSECTHPKEYRINLTSMGGPEHWQCKICGFEYINNVTVE